ncbi:MAG: peptidylprolyl isomerase [Bacteroidales bacterium]
MKSIKLIRIIAGLFIFSILSAFQIPGNNPDDDPVLLKINEREVTVSEFEYVYSKNNLNPQVMDPRSVEEYLELFINFNLKVYEAMQLGLDTHASFIDELEGYRKQLAQPYLNDQKVADHLVEEALERMQYDIRASHILISVEEHAAPADTLEAWNKIMEIRERIVKGEDFAQLAVEYSDDTSAKDMPATANRPGRRGNKGNLGYFSVFNMVYPFETAAYNTPVNEISMPVRTNFGYHIIKVDEKLPAMGKARVAHIMASVPADAPDDNQKQAKEKIEEIYQKLIEGGEDFESLAQRFSDDKASARRGGEFPAFTSNRMVPEFIKAISDLEEGQISKPVRTDFGWHIIKLFEKTLPDKDEALADVKSNISRDSRARISQNAVVERLKKQYDFEESSESLNIFFELVDESIFQGQWDKDIMGERDEFMFGFADKTFTQQDFADYLGNAQSVRTPESVRNYVSTMYLNFQNQSILGYEEKQLDKNYPEFRQIMKEYHDGILLFELTDQKVWSKAMEDTAGLRKFFEDNIKDYMWEDRFDVEIYTFNDEKGAKSGRKEIRRAHRRDESHDEIMSRFNQSSQLEVSAEKGIFEIDHDPVLSELDMKSGVSPVLESGQNYVVIRVNEFLPSQPKKLSEIRGLVIADYQNYLEKQWVQELRQKYEYTVNREALNSMISE